MMLSLSTELGLFIKYEGCFNRVALLSENVRLPDTVTFDVDAFIAEMLFLVE